MTPGPGFPGPDGVRGPDGVPIPFDERRIARAFGVPDHLVGIPTPWWRRLIQRFTRR